MLSHVYVDTVGEAGAHAARLKRNFPAVEFTVESKADATYPIVGAASIVAKTCRDAVLKETMKKAGFEDAKFGSGYPGKL